jgi:hypothetical protein
MNEYECARDCPAVLVGDLAVQSARWRRSRLCGGDERRSEQGESE